MIKKTNLHNVMTNTSTLIASLLVFLIIDLYKSKTSVRVKTKMLKWMLTVIESLWDRTVLRVTERTCAWLSFFFLSKETWLKAFKEHWNDNMNTTKIKATQTDQVLCHTAQQSTASKQLKDTYLMSQVNTQIKKKRQKHGTNFQMLQSWLEFKI